MAGGAQFGYALVWVVLGRQPDGDAGAVPVGQARHRHRPRLPEVCRDRLPRPVVVIFLWLQAELVAMATDLAEFVGAALGLNLVFGLPLWWPG